MGQIIDINKPIAHLQMGISTMCEWLVSVGEIDASTSTALCEKSWGVFIALAEEQNRRISEEKPVKLFLDAVKELLDRGTVKVLSTKSPLSGSPLTHIGYRDDSFYYFFPDSVYSEVKRFYNAQDKNFPLGKTALFQQLANERLIETDNDQTTKSKRIGGKRPRFLWLKVEALEAFEDSADIEADETDS